MFRDIKYIQTRYIHIYIYYICSIACWEHIFVSTHPGTQFYLFFLNIIPGIYFGGTAARGARNHGLTLHLKYGAIGTVERIPTSAVTFRSRVSIDLLTFLIQYDIYYYEIVPSPHIGPKLFPT